MMKGFNLVQTIGGIKRLEVNAEEAQIYLKEKIMKFYDVKVKYFDKGKEISNLKSNEGVIYTDINEMELLGKVEIIAESNTKLETKKLRWIERDNKLFTDDFVKITRGDNVMMGYGMESDLNLENIVIKEVKTKITDLESIEEKKGSK
jgi:LPS export ABC transporter protein LptC